MHTTTASAETRPAVILHVEDNEAIACIRTRLLREAGYRVVQAGSGEEALELLTTIKPQLVLLDVMLPVMNGLEVCRKIKRDPATQHVMVLQASGVKGSAMDRAAGLDGGADAYLVEPIEPVELLATVRALLRLADREAENRRLIQDLSRAERQFAEATEAGNLGLWDWDIVGGTLEWFGAHERLAGILPGSFSDKIGVFVDILHPDDRERVFRTLQETMARRAMHYVDEYRFVHPDGTIHWMVGTGQFFYDDQRPIRMTGVVKEITARKRTEERARQLAAETVAATAKFRAVFDQSAIFAGIMSLDGIVLEANRAAVDVCGYHAEAVLGRPFWETPWWRGSEEVQDKLRAATLQAAQGIIYREVLRYLWADDTERVVDFTLHPIRDEQGRVMFLHPTGVDITDVTRRQSNLALLTDIQDVISRLSSAEGIMRIVTQKITAYLGLSRFLLAEIDEVAQQADVFYDYTEPGRSSVVGFYSIKDFHLEAEQRQLAAGHTLSIDDVKQEPRSKAVADRFDAFGIGALTTVPYISNGRWKFVLCATHSKVYRWRADEVELLTNLAARICLRLERAKGETALREAHHKLEAVLSSITDGLLVMDKDWRFTYVNEQGASMIGQRTEQLIGSCVWDLFPHAQGTKFYECYHRAVESRRPVHFEEFYPEPLNTWFECRCYPSSKGLSVYFQDITTRKQTEVALQQNAALFSTLIEQAPTGVYVVDAQFRLQQVNAEAMPFFEAVHPLIGRDFGEIMSILWGREVGERCAAIFRHTLETGERYISPSFSERRHDLGVEQAFEWETQRVTLPDRGYGVVCYFREVTERARADRALRDSEERTRLATTATGVGIWEWNLVTNTILWDAEMFRIYGIAPAPERIVPYSTWSEAVLQEDLPRQEAVLQDTVRRGGQSSREFRIRRAHDRELRHIQAVETCRLNTNGHVEWVVGTNLDITERKQAEKALRVNEERLRTFAVQLEQLVCERTKELVQSQEQLRAHAMKLNLAEHRERKRLADELHDYLAQLLVFCRLNLGQIKRIGLSPKAEEKVRETEEVLSKALHYSRTLMAELSPPVLQEHGLPAGLRWLGEQMAHRGLTVRVDAGGAADVRLPDDSAVLLFQSVRELLLNALKYAECHEVAVRMEQADGRLRIEICDDGVGFDPVAADSYNSTAMSSKFGLFSIRERMTALGGWFDLKSSPGEGTSAALVMPLEQAEVNVTNAEPFRGAGSRSDDSARHQQDTKQIRVLLVDDHAMVRQGLKSVLDSYADIEVIGEAWDGEGAIAAAERLRPVIVVMDINMPKLNGIEATAHIKARYPEIIVIGMSVQAGGANEEAMKKAGASMLLTKEAAVDELYRAILTVLKDPLYTGQYVGDLP
ncbi:MAG: PAS domain S-box protein [Nitrospirales bacterium]